MVAPSPQHGVVKQSDLNQIQKVLEDNVKDPTQRSKLLAKITAISTSHSGPLPSPECLKEYDTVLPGLAERIVKMAENQSEHRIEIEKKVVTAQLRESKIGQNYGLIIGLGGLIACVVLAINGHDNVAGIIGGSTLISLVTVFVYGKKSQRRDLDKKS